MIKAKITGCCFFVVLFVIAGRSQNKGQYDESALLILDRTSQLISGLKSCSFHLRTSTDRYYRGETQTEINNNEVFMSSPDKLMVDVIGDRGHRAYFYNGTTLTYFSFSENNYTQIKAPPTVLETFDSVSAAYGIEFPAADFFYPDFTDDLLANSENISFEGHKQVDAKECFHVKAGNKDMNVQIWISSGAIMLPQRVVISYYDGKLVKRYEGVFTDWELNPDLPGTLFEFMPPPKAKEVYMVPNKERPVK